MYLCETVSRGENTPAMSETAALATTARTEVVVTQQVLPADRHPAAVYLARLSERSRRPMRHALDVMADLVAHGENAASLNWWDLRYQHTQAIRSALMEYRKDDGEPLSPSTINAWLSALRGVLKECWRLGYTDAETYHRAADIESVRGEALPRGRALTKGEIYALFEVCRQDESAGGVRDAAMFGVLYIGGLRRSELVALNAADYDPETTELRIRHAKGGRERIVYASNGAADALVDWLVLRGDEDGPLFCPVHRSGNIHFGRMSSQAVFNMCAKRLKQAGIKDFSPHDLRRTFISDLLDAGADISTVQRLAGHANVTTTQRYDRRDEKAKQKAAELLTVPYVGRQG